MTLRFQASSNLIFISKGFWLVGSLVMMKKKSNNLNINIDHSKNQMKNNKETKKKLANFAFPIPIRQEVCYGGVSQWKMKQGYLFT